MAEVIFNKLEKVYSNGFKAVHGIDLKIADGEFMVIVGPSGCGKTPPTGAFWVCPIRYSAFVRNWS